MRSLVVGVLILSSVIQTALSLECYSCFPPMPQEDCKKSGLRMKCNQWESIGYESCVEVEYNGNDTLVRSCYPSYKCDGAREWCRRYGPCTVKCCDSNLCNSGPVISTSKVLSFLMAIAAVVYNV